MLALSLALASALAGAPPPSAAPLGVRYYGTLREPFLAPLLTDAREPGPPSLHLALVVANSWSVPTRLVRGDDVVDVQTDEQLEELSLALALPFWRRPGGAPRAEAGLEVKAIRHRGGFTDFIVESWHRHGGFTNFGRERHPMDAVNLVLAQEGGATLVDVRAATSGLGDVALRGRVVLAEGGPGFRGAARWGLSAAAALEAPTGSRARLTGSGAWDAGVSALGTFEVFSWLTVHGQVGVVRPGRFPRGFPLQPAAAHLTAEVSIAAEALGFTLVVEDRIATRLFERGWHARVEPPDFFPHTAANALLRPHNQITTGLRFGPATLWFVEDFTPGDPKRDDGRGWFYDSNHPDVAAGLTLRHAW